MSAVARVENIVPGNYSRIVDEVVAIDVALIAVVVVVLVRACEFVLVDPDIISQVGMLDKYTLIQDRYNDRLVATRTQPSTFSLHIGTCHRFFNLAFVEFVATIGQIPLLGE